MRHGSRLDPPNPYRATQSVPDGEHWEWDEEYLAAQEGRPIEYLADSSRSIVSENDSPDIPFRYSVNPYRGCAHGCSYCYARNTHEYLGLNAGLDFETKIFVKHDAPLLLREFLANDRWTGESLMFSGVTDCYQPGERRFRLTRGCLELAHACSQSVSIVTKNALIVRDLDLLADMAARNLVHVGISLCTLDEDLARSMEPRTSIPAARLRAIRLLAEAGVPVMVMAAPLIPGLNNHGVADVLKAAREAGATAAGYTFLRLPLTVEPVFLEWLHRERPGEADKVTGQLRQSRGGRLNSSNFGERMRGSGPIAEQIRQMFQVLKARFGYTGLLPLDTSQFRPPTAKGGQLRLF
ncbi:MAG: PA0069 family radical SAM protein [Planctomycetaceae bacterium]|nr:PA0069 family radical SAM protein [Planctomycetaceae bacterium]